MSHQARRGNSRDRHARDPTIRPARSDQPLRGTGGFTGPVARQPLQCVVALDPTRSVRAPRRPERFRASGTADESPPRSPLAAGGSCRSGWPPRRAPRRFQPMAASRPARTAAAASIGKRPGSAPRRRERMLLVRAKELIAPGDRRIHRLLAFGQIARAGGREQNVVPQSAEQILGRQHFHPRGCELERERQGIQPATNRRHGGAVRGREAKVRLHVPNPSTKEPHRGRARQIRGRHRTRIPCQLERSDGVLPLSPDTERSAAGDQHSERRDRCQEIDDQRRRVQYLLEIVEHQQRWTIAARDPSAHR